VLIWNTPVGDRKAFAPRAPFKYAGGNLPSGREIGFLEQRRAVVPYIPDADVYRIGPHQRGWVWPQDHLSQLVQRPCARLARPPSLAQQDDRHTIHNGATERVGDGVMMVNV
jgi:hypothetical protein